jgi:hypothetical protein
MRKHRVHSLAFAAFAAVSFSLGCTSEKIVYKSGTDFAAPPAASKSFVGYYDEANKATVCGSCHAEKQVAWKTTKHASAWADLSANTSKAGYCEACHTVNNLGNAATDTASGWRSTKDARFHDVQCESCHGAGLTHASAPNATNRPLASIAADTTATNGCGECHSGTHNPFAREWKLSGHSQTWEASHNSTDPYCQGCHTGQGALLTWQKGGNYVEKNSTAMLPATCAVCHDPHGNTGVDKQLRFPLNAANLENNLCIKCHQRRGTIQDAIAQGRNSVHSPEGPTLLGQSGWFPPGMSVSDSLVATHGSSTKNPKLCATCHVQKYSGTDPVTKQAVNSTGHRFLATPCVAASGLPLDDQTNCQPANMTFRSCLASGCHGTETAARNAMNTANLRIANLVTQANTLITQAKAGPKASECTFATTKPYSTCMGMQFNISVATKVGGVIHNPFLVEQLMLASINQMKKDYNLTVTVDMTPMFKRGVIVSEGGR